MKTDRFHEFSFKRRQIVHREVRRLVVRYCLPIARWNPLFLCEYHFIEW